MKLNQKIFYRGICNPSAAIALDNSRFIVADDEDNVLRIYDKNRTDSPPLQTIFLKDVFKHEIVDGEDMEIDLEGAAELAGQFFWIGSHSTSRTGDMRLSRHRLFAMQISLDGKGQYQATPSGKIYTRLIDDLMKDSRYADYHFDRAQNRPPKALGGLSIEGLAATHKNELLIGFRNPLAGGKKKDGLLMKGKALLVPLLNPFEIIYGLPAKFGDPIELNLKGQGIRDIVARKKRKFVIVAGPYHENAEAKESNHLYTWSSKSGKLKHLKKMNLHNLNIEAAFFYPGNHTQVHLLSDDGNTARTDEFSSLWLKIM
jgi:Protein of unknown function (DUF3616)